MESIKTVAHQFSSICNSTLGEMINDPTSITKVKTLALGFVTTAPVNEDQTEEITSIALSVFENADILALQNSFQALSKIYQDNITSHDVIKKVFNEFAENFSGTENSSIEEQLVSFAVPYFAGNHKRKCVEQQESTDKRLRAENAGHQSDFFSSSSEGALIRFCLNEIQSILLVNENWHPNLSGILKDCLNSRDADEIETVLGNHSYQLQEEEQVNFIEKFSLLFDAINESSHKEELVQGLTYAIDVLQDDPFAIICTEEDKLKAMQQMALEKSSSLSQELTLNKTFEEALTKAAEGAMDIGYRMTHQSIRHDFENLMQLIQNHPEQKHHLREMMKELNLSRDHALNAYSDDGETLLLSAIRKGFFESIRILIDGGADETMPIEGSQLYSLNLVLNDDPVFVERWILYWGEYDAQLRQALVIEQLPHLMTLFKKRHATLAYPIFMEWVRLIDQLNQREDIGVLRTELTAVRSQLVQAIREVEIAYKPDSLLAKALAVYEQVTKPHTLTEGQQNLLNNIKAERQIYDWRRAL